MPLITDPEKDPFGAAMWAWYKGRQNAVVTVYSDIAVDDIIPVRYLFRSRSNMPDWEVVALDACRGRVLDIGAGTGCHSLEIQHMNLEVVAIDISPGAVSMMKTRGVRQVEHQSFWDYKGGKFDTLFLMMNGIGLVGNLKGLNQFLQKARQILMPGGQILLDSSDIAYLFEDDIDLVPNPLYYGIIQYRMEFEKIAGNTFEWLYIDYPRLKKHAGLFGFTCEKLAEGGHFEYLARLRFSGSDT